ncbi:hypothetical protein OSB04_024295 [Centaurea solstitialis]|uniref:Uncharacterized protein n=1 Tax=Centaurea solstitialis TaxID=347529 RepID=A0AA38SLG6_9ASTR|nr:hypothetical protein OSB04_024295 [Centaurea solstitialis]
MSYDIEQPAITEFRLQITSMLFLSSAKSSTLLMESWINKKPYDMYSVEQRAQAAIDKRTLTLLTMVLPNDMCARVDSCKDARSMWLGIEQQMQGG